MTIGAGIPTGSPHRFLRGSMLHIVCVQTGNYLGRGPEYVNTLYDMVRRNLEAGLRGEFVCFTDSPFGLHKDIVTRPVPDGLEGWWHKLWLFSPGLFPEGDRVVFLDLDTLVLGALDDIVKYDGEFAMLRDFYRDDGFQSSVMCWRAGFGQHLWDDYVKAGKPTHDIGGDQSWIEKRTRPDALQDLFPDAFVSYKVHCQKYPPKGAKVIVFHGRPRPHEVGGWVADVWKIGGVGSLEVQVRCNTENEQIKRNIEYALSLNLPELTQQVEHDGSVCIVGGAPSVKNYIPELAGRAQNGQQIWALNNAAKFLSDNGVPVHGQWLVDARALNARFVIGEGLKFIASQCHRDTFDAALPNVMLYHDANGDEFIPRTRPVSMLGGGTTVAIKALCGAYALGYRKIHLYGMDSSHDGDAHHAYEQPENDNDGAVEVSVAGKTFMAAPWMIRQVEDFIGLSDELAGYGCEIHVHCGGLLGHVARALQAERERPVTIDGDIALVDGLWRPVTDRVSVPAVQGEVWKIERIVQAMPADRRRTVVQAGGHVGIFAQHLAHAFDRVLTFEPDPTNYKCLVRNVTMENVTAHQAAIGSKPGFIALTERDANNAGSIGVDPDGKPTAMVWTVDSLQPKNVDLIYLDIEGMEGPALWGAKETVRRDRPLIVCENKGLDAVSGAGGQLDEFLLAHGYRKVARYMRDDVFAPAEVADAITGKLLAA